MATEPNLAETNRSGEPRPDFITQLVAGAVAILAAELPRSLKVDEMPDKPVEYDIGSTDGVVLVHYRGSRYAPPQTNGAPSQDRTVTLDVRLLVRGLAGSKGAHALLEAVRTSLQGRTIVGARGFTVVEDGLIAERGGIWDYAMVFQAIAPAVARRHPPYSPLHDTYQLP